MATVFNSNTYVSNFNADDQPEGVELMTDERGHLYPLAHIVDGQTLGDALLISPNTPADMSVSITAGYCQVPFDDYAYQCWLEQDGVLNIEASDQSLNRISYIVAYIDRSKIYEESVTNNPGLLCITEVKGTAAATPAVPSKAQIQSAVGADNPYIILAQVYVPANASTITASNLTDARVKMTLKSGIDLPSSAVSAGIYPVQSTSSATAQYPIKIAIIGANDPLPTPDAGTEMLVFRISQ